MAASVCVFDRIGGDTALRGVVDRFYDLIETDSRGANILRMHLRGHGLAHVRAEQFDFMSGFLGGPPRYSEQNGHMNIRLIHDHLQIETCDAENWLALMDQALEEADLSDTDAVEEIKSSLRRVALMLVNSD